MSWLLPLAERRGPATLLARDLADRGRVAMRITNLFNELRRRRVFRMTGWYVVASWVLIQVVSEALPALNLDERFIKYFWLAALGGFPIAVIFSWRYDVTSHGIKRTAAGIETAPEALRVGRADYLLLGALAVVAGIGVYGLSQKAVEEAALLEATPETREIRQQSIAVLPLENLSPESTEQYFVTGMYDSLISNLGKINALQVTSRTSASRVNTSQGIPVCRAQAGRQICDRRRRIPGRQPDTDFGQADRYLVRPARLVGNVRAPVR